MDSGGATSDWSLKSPTQRVCARPSFQAGCGLRQANPGGSKPRWCWPDDSGSPPGPSVFSFVLQIFSFRGEPWRKRRNPSEGTPAHPGLQAQGSRGSEGDRGRWESGEKAEERVRGSPGRRASCVHPLGACARFLAPPSPAKGRGPVPLRPSLRQLACSPAEETPLGLAGRHAPSGGGKEAGGAGPGPRLGQSQLGRRGARGSPGPRCRPSSRHR